jgi:DNA-binding response OmpR family regulator
MRILLIEDEKKIGLFLKDKLEEKCFSVDIAPDGEKGSFLGRTNDYDLILLDNILPKKSGQEVCKEIRERGRHMPILVISVKDETTAKVDLLNAGADDYLPKPFSFDELLARIGALLRRPRHIEEQLLQAADLTLNVTTFTVERGKKEVYLTRKEFSLLWYMMRNKGVVLSRGMLLEHVWDMDTDPFSNTIEAHVASLRRKIEPKGAKKLIKTIPGRGYKIEVA